jgi:hypothetical protein
VRTVLGGRRPPWPAAWPLLPAAADRLLRRLGRGARDRVARGRLKTDAIVGVTAQDADDGDTTTCVETLIDAAARVETVRPEGEGIEEILGDRGYHTNQSLVDFEAVGIRSYISEPDGGRRNWAKHPTARHAVYRDRRRIRGPHGRRLLRLRGERLERSFANLYGPDDPAEHLDAWATHWGRVAALRNQGRQHRPASAASNRPASAASHQPRSGDRTDRREAGRTDKRSRIAPPKAKHPATGPGGTPAGS